MTWAAVALGLFQIPFLLNIVLSLRQPQPQPQITQITQIRSLHRADRFHDTGPMPWTFEPRPDSRTTNVRLGIWLFLASEAMLFGSLFSAYVLLRTGAANWADPWQWLSPSSLILLTAVLVVASVTPRRGIWVSTAAGIIFLGAKAFEFAQMLDAGMYPVVDLTLACWFVLTGMHWLHVAGGVCANVWIATSARQLPAAHQAERLHALGLYWIFVDAIWLAILVSFLL
jgi:heme/copper-type cytochrome/quinol oxidase subunit 3